MEDARRLTVNIAVYDLCVREKEGLGAVFLKQLFLS